MSSKLLLDKMKEQTSGSWQTLLLAINALVVAVLRFGIMQKGSLSYLSG